MDFIFVSKRVVYGFRIRRTLRRKVRCKGAKFALLRLVVKLVIFFFVYKNLRPRHVN